MRTARSISNKVTAMFALAVTALVVGAAPAHAVVGLAGPGASFAGYATPTVVVPRGGPLTFANADLADHTLTSEARLPRRIAKKTRYCRTYGVRSCPLFTSAIVGAGESAQVAGIQRARPGREYEFRCQIHSGMRGTLVVLGAGARTSR